MFLSVASSGCHPDVFAIVVKDSWEHRLSLSLTETVQFGKQWITWAPRCWINWKESVSITSSSLCLYSSTHAFLNASLQNGSLFIAFPVFQGWQGERVGATEGVGGRSYWLKHEDIRWDKSFIASQTVQHCECYAETVDWCHIYTKLFFSKLNCLQPLLFGCIQIRIGLRLDRMMVG